MFPVGITWRLHTQRQMIAHHMAMGGLPWAVIKNNKKEIKKKDPLPTQVEFKAV